MRGPLDEIIHYHLYMNACNREDGLFCFMSHRFVNHYILLDVSSNNWNEICLIDALIENGHSPRKRVYRADSTRLFQKIIIPFIYGCANNWFILNDDRIIGMLKQIR